MVDRRLTSPPDDCKLLNLKFGQLRFISRSTLTTDTDSIAGMGSVLGLMEMQPKEGPVSA